MEQIPTPVIPGHVSEEQTCPHNIFTLSPESDITEEMSRIQENMPDIFYNPTPQLDRSFSKGAWVITSHAMAKEVLSDPGTFSSVGISGFAELVNLDYDLMIPIDIDPPLHPKVRMMLREYLSPKAVAELEGDIRLLARELVTKAKEKGSCDFMLDVAQIFPTQIFLLLMGLPMEEYHQFLEWEADLLQPDPNNIQKTIDAIMSIVDRVQRGFEEKRKNPGNDLLTMLVNAEIDGGPISEELRTGLGFNLFVGGLDTVINQLSWVFKYLAEHPESRQKLRGNPEAITLALEEIMRTHSVLTTRRFATKDLDFHGVRIKKGDSVELPFMAINRDPEAFECPMNIDLERKPNRHVGFSFGPHTCIGMHLARLEMRILVEEWLEQLPEFHIKEGEKLTFHAGIFGLDRLPLEWD